MKLHKWNDIKNKGLTPEQIEESDRQIERELLEMELRDLRQLLGLTQEQVAKIAEMTQSELSKAERRSDRRISTLRRIVEALGGQLEVHAIFNDKDVKLAI
jgi:transcriptional regulator with XRE-family HTH domain